MDLDLILALAALVVLYSASLQNYPPAPRLNVTTPLPAEPDPCVVTLETCARRQVVPTYGDRCDYTAAMCNCEHVHTNHSRVDLWLYTLCVQRLLNSKDMASWRHYEFYRMAAEAGMHPDDVLNSGIEPSRKLPALLANRCFQVFWTNYEIERSYKAQKDFVKERQDDWSAAFASIVKCNSAYARARRFCTRHLGDAEYEWLTTGDLDTCIFRNSFDGTMECGMLLWFCYEEDDYPGPGITASTEMMKG